MSSARAESRADEVLAAALPRVLAVAQGDPLGTSTWSGTSASLFTEFCSRGQLVGAVDTSLPRPAEMLARGVTIHPNLHTWRERSSLGRLRAGATAALGRRGMRGAPGADVVLQIGSWNTVPRSGDAVRALYLDSAIAQLLQRTDTHLGESSAFAQWRLGFERRVYDEVDVVFTMSEWTRRSLIADLGVAPDKVVLARPGPNGAPDARADGPHPPGPDAHAPHTPADEPESGTWRGARGPHLLFVGKKWERKGGPAVLAAFAELRRTHPDALLSIVGPTQSCPPYPGVRSWGRLDRSDPVQARLFDRLFATADLLVMPSRYEPFGMVFVEAMSRGVPCVAADHNAMPEIITDAVTGRLVPPGDVPALAEVLRELADSPDTVRQMGRLAREDAAARYTWAGCVDTMNAAFAAAG